jgi:Ca2+-binding RTX toxin-like protein
VLVNIENLAGSEYDDVLSGDGFRNELYGRAGNDTLKGGGGYDRLAGDAGNDILMGGADGDYMHGGTGFDTASYEGSSTGVVVSLIGDSAAYGDAEGDTLDSIENLTGSRHADNLLGDDGTNDLNGLDGHDTLKGYGGADDLAGGIGDDILIGGDGSDTLRGDEGADTTNGGKGEDVHIVDTAADRAIEAAGEGTFDWVRTSSSYVLLAGSEVEYLSTNPGTAAIDLVGNEFNQTIVGNNGSNTIVGSPGNDGGGYDGRDVMAGYGGGDVFVWTSTNETRLAGQEADVVMDFYRAGGDLLAFNAIDANATGGTANDTFSFVGVVDVTQGGSFAGVGQIGYFTTSTDTYILLNTEVDAGIDYQDATIRVAGVHTVDASWFVL